MDFGAKNILKVGIKTLLNQSVGKYSRKIKKVDKNNYEHSYIQEKKKIIINNKVKIINTLLQIKYNW